MIGSLLIANRGEIAVRIIRACDELGIRTIAIHSEADDGALWTRMADHAIAIGPSAPATYLDIPRIVEAAKGAGADAIHPGYGLLSESADFARAVGDAGMVFVGPSPENMALMGDKVSARAAAARAGIPILPGTDRPVAGDDEAQRAARSIGWPVAVKASFGGGGRGMRVATGPASLADALAEASREARSAFGRGEVFLERFLERPRHIEVQILGDAHGNLIHLGDRDCSVQRRHQKLVEEAPAPALDDRLRERIRAAGAQLGRDIGYQGAGTVEFLVDAGQHAFYFLEMNTRLQVEHGVSELVTGIDLVKHQIRIAAGEPLSLLQCDVRISGHAVQARIAAEDPWEDFRPVPGRIDRLALPARPWLRCDFGVEGGDSVPGYYDSMFGKLLAWGGDRDEAIVRLGLGLDELTVTGLPTTAPYLRGLLDQPAFREARHDTGSLERDWQPDCNRRPTDGLALPAAKDGAGERTIERRVAVPWGEGMVEVAVFGKAAPMAASIGNAGRQARGAAGRGGGSGPGPVITAPMEAIVLSISRDVGEVVTRGDPIMILEAMKMEVVLRAPHDGRVESMLVQSGQAVKTGAALAKIGPAAGQA